MWLSNTLAWFISVFLLKSLLTECYPRTFQQGGSFIDQQLLNNQVALQQIPSKINDPVPQQRRKAVAVYCHEEAIEVVMNTDVFASGLPVYTEELWLGPQPATTCGAVQTGQSELTILAYLNDCGTQLSVTGDSLVYSNVVVYSPKLSPDGVIHMDGAAIPVQCQYQRWYSVDSAAVAPTWIPFASTVQATDHLDFSLRLMSDDWQYERGSNVYFLGDSIHLHASVTLANHLPLLLFIDWCVATPTLDVDTSEVKYSFLDYHGCLADSRSLYSHSKFLQRSKGNELNLLLDAFRFHKLTSNLVYIHCYLKAVPAAYSVSTLNRACSFVDGRWWSVDGNDEVCNTCEPSKQGVAESDPVQPLHITLAPPVKQPNLAPKPGPAGFFHVRPGQSLDPFKALIQSKQSAYGGLSKRGTDSSKAEWKTVATLGPLLLTPEQKTTTPSTEDHKFGPDDVFGAAFVEEPELLFNFTEMGHANLEPAPKFRSFDPLHKSLSLNASDFFTSEEGSGSEQ